MHCAGATVQSLVYLTTILVFLLQLYISLYVSMAVFTGDLNKPHDWSAPCRCAGCSTQQSCAGMCTPARSGGQQQPVQSWGWEVRSQNLQM